jgi:hypothetical protein
MKHLHITFQLQLNALKALFFGGVILFVSACSENKDLKPTIILLPENYVGSFHIMFEVPKGQPPKYEKDTQVYEIPSSGVLLPQTELNISTLHYYYVNSDGTRTPITDRWTTSIPDTPENRQDKRIIIFGGGVGDIEPVPGCKATDLSFGVGTKSDMLDNINLFGIYDDQHGIRSMDQSIFDGMCPERDKGEPSVYLLPENYTGTFYIIYNAPNGQPAIYEDGAQVYKIPDSGLLLTQTSGNDIWAESPNLQYYYVHNDGSRTEITERWPLSIRDTPENRKDKQIFMLRASLGGLEVAKGCNLQGQLFAVGTKADIWDSNSYFDFNSINKATIEGVCFKP